MLAGDTLLFSKKQAGRFPEDGEVEDRFAIARDGKALPPIEPAGAGPIRRLVDKIFG